MDFLQAIRISTVPLALKVALLVLGVGVLFLNGFVIYQGFLRTADDFWIAAGAQLLSVILPLVLLFLLIEFAHGGSKALKDRTRSLLVDRIPAQFLKLAEPRRAEFAVYRSRTPWLPWLRDGAVSAWNGIGAVLGRDAAEAAGVTVSYRFEENTCYADYRIEAPGLLSAGSPRAGYYFRVELNVKRANVVVWVPGRHSAEINKFLACFKDAGDGRLSFAPPPACDKLPFQSAATGILSAGYVLNPTPVERAFDGVDFQGLVFIRTLPDDFLWNAAEQLFFVQDLMFMIRALIMESAVSRKGRPVDMLGIPLPEATGA